MVGYGPHAHEFFEMLLFESGGGVHVVDGVEHRARRGVAWLLRPGVSHDLAGLSDARGWLVIASSDVLGLPPWDNGATTWPAHPLLGAFCHVEPSGRPIPLQLSSRRLRRWLDWVLQLHGEVQAARPGYEHAARALLQLLLVDAARLVPAPVEAATHPLVERALQHVEAGFQGSLSLADVAGALAVTPGHLTEVVRRQTVKRSLARRRTRLHCSAPGARRLPSNLTLRSR